MKTTRTYTMRARAEAAKQTRRRIIDATYQLSGEKPLASVVLPDIAERAGVSVQTILRQFGSRDGLFDATVQFVGEQTDRERRMPPGDVPAVVRIIFDHYETHGDGVLVSLAQEQWDERMAAITAKGKQLHRNWVTEAFEPLIAERTDREELTDLLVVATDVYTWKLLRRDRGLPRDAARQRVLRMINAILKGDPE